MTEVIQAHEVLQMCADSKPSKEKITKFNELIMQACKAGSFELHLWFEDWGYSKDDVAFILDAGYTVHRNSACLWWEVTLPSTDI